MSMKYLAYFQATGAHYERTNVRSTIEDRLRISGVLAAIRSAALEDIEHHNEKTRLTKGSHADVESTNQGENIISHYD